jgi:hypothetical protein
MNNMTDMAEQLDVKLLLSTLMALKKGDFSVRMPSDCTGPTCRRPWRWKSTDTR